VPGAESDRRDGGSNLARGLERPPGQRTSIRKRNKRVQDGNDDEEAAGVAWTKRLSSTIGAIA
jgi:hypothetical protein